MTKYLYSQGNIKEFHLVFLRLVSKWMANPESVDFAIIEPYLGSPTEDSTVPKD
jgi:hypothetical protein